MKNVLRVLGLSLVLAVALLKPAHAYRFYYCGHCTVSCGGDETHEYYNISADDCCALAGATGCQGAVWWPEMCNFGEDAVIC